MATVIKSPNAPAKAGTFSLGDIAVEAKGIIEHARRQAEQIIADAHAAAADIQAQGRQAGYQDGLAAGREEGHKTAREQAAKQFEQQIGRAGRTLAEAAEQLNACKGRVLAEARQDLVALALAVAEKVVRCRLAGDAEAARRTVDAAVELAGRASRLSVKVNPADLETIRAFAPELAARLIEPAEVQVAADPAVEPGGCRIVAWRDTGQSSEIDATIQTQLTRLANELLGKSETD